MSNKPTTTDKPKKKNRAPELLAAGAALELARIDATIVRAQETIKQKESEKKAVRDGLEDDALAILKRMRGEVAP